jgi:hypothetical protein
LRAEDHFSLCLAEECPHFDSIRDSLQSYKERENGGKCGDLLVLAILDHTA